MKLLYCIPSLYNSGGTERVLTTKLNYLSKIKDFEIIVVTTEQMGKPFFFEVDSSIKFIHLEIQFLEAFEDSLISKYIRYRQKLNQYKKKLSSIIIEQKIDICVSLCGKEIEFLSQLDVPCKKVAELHYTINYRELYLQTNNKISVFWKVFGRIRTWQLINAVKRFDKLVVLTEQDKNNVKVSNAVCIYNPSPFTSEYTPPSIKLKCIISIGSLVDVKGYDMLIKAWSQVNFQYPDWQLNIFGEGVKRQQLEQLIAQNNLLGKVFLHGQISNVRLEYLQSSIYVMSSRYEGLPMVLIEAMSCGLPIVSFDCPCGPREIITDGVDGFLVEPNNTQELADKLCLLIENENLRNEMGSNAIVKSERFRIENIMPQWICLFEELIQTQN